MTGWVDNKGLLWESVDVAISDSPLVDDFLAAVLLAASKVPPEYRGSAIYRNDYGSSQILWKHLPTEDELAANRERQTAKVLERKAG